MPTMYDIIVNSIIVLQSTMIDIYTRPPPPQNQTPNPRMLGWWWSMPMDNPLIEQKKYEDVGWVVSNLILTFRGSVSGSSRNYMQTNDKVPHLR